MKGFKWWFACLALVAFVGTATAQTKCVQQQGDGSYWNTCTHQKCDAKGNVLVKDVTAAGDLYTSAPSAVIAATLTPNVADSTATLVDIHAFEHVVLMVDADCGFNARFAMSIALAINAPSMGDTTAFYYVPAFHLQPSDSVGGTVVATIRVSPGTMPSATVPGEYEWLASFTSSANTTSAGGYNPANRTYALNYINGGPVRGDKLKVKIRYLGGAKTSVPVKVYVVGFAR